MQCGIYTRNCWGFELRDCSLFMPKGGGRCLEWGGGGKNARGMPGGDVEVSN